MRNNDIKKNKLSNIPNSQTKIKNITFISVYNDVFTKKICQFPDIHSQIINTFTISVQIYLDIFC